MSELEKGRASCTNIHMTSTVRSALCEAGQLPGEGHTDVEDATAPAC